MSNVTADPGGTATAPEQQKLEVVDSMTGTVDQWKARIDELKVQVDLAKLDARERATKQLDIAQNACLAAYSKLRDAGHDAAVNADTLRDGVQKLLHDVKEAFEAAQAVISRG
ncbi:MAG: hypothetical protein P4L20_15955 [Acidimicrobiales bacterium]|jgi:hypothetical protein|nr:hypothetical protein [Acidimicrobiales bacterium]